MLAFDTDAMQPPILPPPEQWVSVRPLVKSRPWYIRALRRLAQLKTLGPNWDGFGSPAIKYEAAQSMQEFMGAVAHLDLPSPHLLPVTGGGLGLALNKWNRELEIEALPTGQLTYLKTWVVGGQEREEDGELMVIRPSAQSLVGWLLASSQA